MGNIKNEGERFVEALFTRPLELSCCVRCNGADAERRSRAVLLEEAPAFFPGDGAVVVLVELTEHHGPHGVSKQQIPQAQQLSRAESLASLSRLYPFRHFRLSPLSKVRFPRECAPRQPYYPQPPDWQSHDSWPCSQKHLH